jgi:hypothetical protein
MNLPADENVPRPIIERLRLDGYIVRAVSEQAAILRQKPVAGVLLLELARLPLTAQVERVAAFLSGGPDLTGKLTVIEPARVGVRVLPDS